MRWCEESWPRVSPGVGNDLKFNDDRFAFPKKKLNIYIVQEQEI